MTKIKIVSDIHSFDEWRIYRLDQDGKQWHYLCTIFSDYLCSFFGDAGDTYERIYEDIKNDGEAFLNMSLEYDEIK